MTQHKSLVGIVVVLALAALSGVRAQDRGDAAAQAALMVRVGD